MSGTVGDAVEVPMFPLGSVLLPGMILPLHVFEDRYRRLVEVVLDLDEPEFGVVLIERGSEVGGGDIRAMIGCAARVLSAARTDDGRWAIVTVGTRPVRVREWLPDDPFPRALVEDLVDDPTLPDDSAERIGSLTVRVRRCLAMASELGLSGAVEVELSDDPVLATYQAAVLAPLGSLDRQRVLSSPSATDRLVLVEDLVTEQLELLEGRLRLGPVDGTEDPWSTG